MPEKSRLWTIFTKPLLLSVAAGMALCATAVTSAHAAEKINFMLNWVAGGDHAPYYYAQKMGWYSKAGLDVNIIQGSGSNVAVQRVAAGVDQIGLADFPTMLIANGKGAHLIAVMAVYANSPQGIYWLKSSGIKSVKDLAGKKIGNPPGDAARAMWPALAKKVGIPPNSVTWVNIAPNAKIAALKAGTIDATTSFYNIHYIFRRVLGKNMGFASWRSLGINPYGNSIFLRESYLKTHKEAVEKFVAVTQKAFAACVATPKPCIDALIEANSGLKYSGQIQNWHEVEELMSSHTTQTVALGWFNPKRMVYTYDLVKKYIGFEKPFPIAAAYTNEFLSKNYKMKPMKLP
jgi:NitT/TauT family transport system substrate-binding protein